MPTLCLKYINLGSDNEMIVCLLLLTLTYFRVLPCLVFTTGDTSIYLDGT